MNKRVYPIGSGVGLGSLPALSLLALALPCLPSAKATTFTDVTLSSGINHYQANGLQAAIADMTGGAAAGDVDGDGLVDLFFTKLNGPDLLYKNNGDGTFTDISIASGFTANLETNGAAFGDIDNDGDLDLYVTAGNDTRYYMYENDGNGNFAEVAMARGVAASNAVVRYGQSVSFGDYDHDGYLDIITNDWGRNTTFSQSKLFRNLGASQPGYFEDKTAASGLNVFTPGRNTVYRFTARFTDLDDDGRTDIAIAADFETSQLFWNNGDGTFLEGTQAANVGTDENGMGTTIGDFDGDGDFDWFVTAIKASPEEVNPIHDGGNRLYVNNGDRTFTDLTEPLGVLDVGWGWGTEFFDYDNDGDLDLIATNGFGGYHQDDPTTIWRNDNGTFTNVTDGSGITDTKYGRGLLTFDYDNDGDQDVLIVNNGDKPILYRNDTVNNNDYLRITTQGTVSNRDGVGAKITVDPDTAVAGDEMVREIYAGSTFLSASEMTAHFGLGDSGDTVDVITIRWPSGITQKFFNVAPNTELLAVEAYLDGDLNGDGFVGVDDLNIVLSAWNTEVTPGMNAWGDPSGDGYVGVDDLNEVLVNWNQGTPPPTFTAAIPEPASLLVMGLGAMGLIRRSRH